MICFPFFAQNVVYGYTLEPPHGFLVHDRHSIYVLEQNDTNLTPVLQHVYYKIGMQKES